MKQLAGTTPTYISNNFGTEPLVVVEIQWANGTVYYSDKTQTITSTSIIGAILDIDTIANVMTLDNQGEISSVNVVLDDSNGAVKSKVNTNIVEGTHCNIYHIFQGQSWSDKTLEFTGKIAGGISWSEADRKLSISIESYLATSVDVGYKLQEDDIVEMLDLVGGFIPLVYGSVSKVRALVVRQAVNAEVAAPFVYKRDVGIDGAVLEIAISGRDLPLQSVFAGRETVIKILIDQDDSYKGILFKGVFVSNNQFVVRTRAFQNYPFYRSVKVGPRVTGDQHENDPRYCWLDSSVDITGMYVLVGNSAPAGTAHHGQVYLNYCESQEINKCKFTYPMGKTNAYGSGEGVNAAVISDTNSWTILECSFAPRSEWLITGSVPYLPPLNNLLAMTTFDSWRIGDGARIIVMESWQSTRDIYLVNLGRTRSIPEVTGRRNNGRGGQTIANVPSTLYRTVLNFALENTQHTAAAVIFTTPLPSYQGWSGELFCKVNAGHVLVDGTEVSYYTPYQIQHLIERYYNPFRNSISDRITFHRSFAETKEHIKNYRSNFVIDSPKDVMKLCGEIAYQARCLFYVENNVAYIKYLARRPSVYDLHEFNTANVIKNSVTLSFTPTNNIVTRLRGIWYKDQVGDVGSRQEYIKEYNIERFGLYEEDLEVFIYNDEANVKRCVDFWAYRKAHSWLLVRLRTTMSSLALQVGDWVVCNLPIISTNKLRGYILEVIRDTANGTADVLIHLASRAGHYGSNNQPVEDENFWSETVIIDDPDIDDPVIDGVYILNKSGGTIPAYGAIHVNSFVQYRDPVDSRKYVIGTKPDAASIDPAYIFFLGDTPLPPDDYTLDYHSAKDGEVQAFVDSVSKAGWSVDDVIGTVEDQHYLDDGNYFKISDIMASDADYVKVIIDDSTPTPSDPLIYAKNMEASTMPAYTAAYAPSPTTLHEDANGIKYFEIYEPTEDNHDYRNVFFIDSTDLASGDYRLVVDPKKQNAKTRVNVAIKDTLNTGSQLGTKAGENYLDEGYYFKVTDLLDDEDSASDAVRHVMVTASTPYPIETPDTDPDPGSSDFGKKFGVMRVEAFRHTKLDTTQLGLEELHDQLNQQELNKTYRKVDSLSICASWPPVQYNPAWFLYTQQLCYVDAESFLHGTPYVGTVFTYDEEGKDGTVGWEQKYEYRTWRKAYMHPSWEGNQDTWPTNCDFVATFIRPYENYGDYCNLFFIGFGWSSFLPHDGELRGAPDVEDFPNFICDWTPKPGAAVSSAKSFGSDVKFVNDQGYSWAVYDPDKASLDEGEIWTNGYTFNTEGSPGSSLTHQYRRISRLGFHIKDAKQYTSMKVKFKSDGEPSEPLVIKYMSLRPRTWGDVLTSGTTHTIDGSAPVGGYVPRGTEHELTLTSFLPDEDNTDLYIFFFLRTDYQKDFDPTYTNVLYDWQLWIDGKKVNFVSETLISEGEDDEVVDDDEYFIFRQEEIDVMNVGSDIPAHSPVQWTGDIRINGADGYLGIWIPIQNVTSDNLDPAFVFFTTERPILRGQRGKVYNPRVKDPIKSRMDATQKSLLIVDPRLGGTKLGTSKRDFHLQIGKGFVVTENLEDDLASDNTPHIMIKLDPDPDGPSPSVGDLTDSPFQFLDGVSVSFGIPAGGSGATWPAHVPLRLEHGIRRGRDPLNEDGFVEYRTVIWATRNELPKDVVFCEISISDDGRIYRAYGAGLRQNGQDVVSIVHPQFKWTVKEGDELGTIRGENFPVMYPGVGYLVTEVLELVDIDGVEYRKVKIEVATDEARNRALTVSTFNSVSTDGQVPLKAAFLTHNGLSISPQYYTESVKKSTLKVAANFIRDNNGVIEKGIVPIRSRKWEPYSDSVTLSTLEVLGSKNIKDITTFLDPDAIYVDLDTDVLDDACTIELTITPSTDVKLKAEILNIAYNNTDGLVKGTNPANTDLSIHIALSTDITGSSDNTTIVFGRPWLSQYSQVRADTHIYQREDNYYWRRVYYEQTGYLTYKHQYYDSTTDLWSTVLDTTIATETLVPVTSCPTSFYDDVNQLPKNGYAVQTWMSNLTEA